MFGWMLNVMVETSQEEASFTVEVRPLMGLVKKRLTKRETKNGLFIKH